MTPIQENTAFLYNLWSISTQEFLSLVGQICWWNQSVVLQRVYVYDIGFWSELVKVFPAKKITLCQLCYKELQEETLFRESLRWSAPNGH